MARLSVKCPGHPERIEKITSDLVIIGRSRSCDITVPDRHLSRQHCHLEKTEDGYSIVDLGSHNGSSLNKEKINAPTRLITGDLISIGQSHLLFVADNEEDLEDDGVEASQTICMDAVQKQYDGDVADSQGAPPKFVLQYLKGDRKRILPLKHQAITIGRHRSCSLVFDHTSVSSCHARIEFKDGQHWVHDLGSTNGVLVNGRKVDSAPLTPGTRIRVGKVTIGFKEVARRSGKPDSVIQASDTRSAPASVAPQTPSQLGLDSPPRERALPEDAEKPERETDVPAPEIEIPEEKQEEDSRAIPEVDVDSAAGEARKPEQKVDAPLAAEEAPKVLMDLDTDDMEASEQPDLPELSDEPKVRDTSGKEKLPDDDVTGPEEATEVAGSPSMTKWGIRIIALLLAGVAVYMIVTGMKPALENAQMQTKPKQTPPPKTAPANQTPATPATGAAPSTPPPDTIKEIF